MNDKLEKLVNRIIKRAENRLIEQEKETIFDLGLDEYGVPFSNGNSDDVYSDGYENGMLQGEYDTARKIKKILNSRT